MDDQAMKLVDLMWMAEHGGAKYPDTNRKSFHCQITPPIDRFCCYVQLNPGVLGTSTLMHFPGLVNNGPHRVMCSCSSLRPRSTKLEVQVIELVFNVDPFIDTILQPLSLNPRVL